MVEREGRGRHAGGRVSVSRQLEETCHRVSCVSTATCDAKRCGMTCICRSRVECAVGSRTCGHAVTGGRVALRGVGGFPSCPPVRPALRLLTYLLRGVREVGKGGVHTCPGGENLVSTHVRGGGENHFCPGLVLLFPRFLTLHSNFAFAHPGRKGRPTGSRFVPGAASYMGPTLSRSLQAAVGRRCR